MNFAPISPFIRHAAKTAYMIGNVVLAARDCHMLYLLSGEGMFEAAGRQCPLVPNTLVYYPYNTPYRITSAAPMLFYTINFDFTQDYADRTVSMIPKEEKKSDPAEALCTLPEDTDSCFSSVLTFRDAVWAEHDLRVICGEGVRQQAGFREAQSAHLRLLLIDMQRRAGSVDHGLCAKIRALIAADPTLNNRALAERLNYHPYYLNEVFRKKEGMTLHAYIRSQRLIKAYELVSATQLTLEEIAAQCGFCSQAHFSTVFRAEYGFTPNRLRKQ